MSEADQKLIRGINFLLNELCRIKIYLSVEPGLALCHYIRALLFAGVRSLFLNVMPRLSKKYQTVAG